jgi:hypothetical protein
MDRCVEQLIRTTLGAIFKRGVSAWNFIEGQRDFIEMSPFCTA